MQAFHFEITVGASAVNLAAAAVAAGAVTPGTLFTANYLPVAKLTWALETGGTGPAFIGSSNVTAAGANRDYSIVAESTTDAESPHTIDSYSENVIQLSQYWVHGTVPGDKVLITYHQA